MHMVQDTYIQLAACHGVVHSEQLSQNDIVKLRHKRVDNEMANEMDQNSSYIATQLDIMALMWLINESHNKYSGIYR